MELRSRQLSSRERKADTHEKIQLGGLVVKAKLRDLDPAILLGALIEVSQTIERADVKRIKAWRSVGIAALSPADSDTK